MTEFNALINDNFKKLPYDEQSRIAGNFFDAELSNDNFRALPAEEQTRIRGNFLASTFREAGIAPAEPEQGPGLLKQFGAQMISDITGQDQPNQLLPPIGSEQVATTEQALNTPLAERLNTPGAGTQQWGSFSRGLLQIPRAVGTMAVEKMNQQVLGESDGGKTQPDRPTTLDEVTGWLKQLSVSDLEEGVYKAGEYVVPFGRFAPVYDKYGAAEASKQIAEYAVKDPVGFAAELTFFKQLAIDPLKNMLKKGAAQDAGLKTAMTNTQGIVDDASQALNKPLARVYGEPMVGQPAPMVPGITETPAAQAFVARQRLAMLEGNSGQAPSPAAAQGLAKDLAYQEKASARIAQVEEELATLKKEMGIEPAIVPGKNTMGGDAAALEHIEPPAGDPRIVTAKPVETPLRSFENKPDVILDQFGNPISTQRILMPDAPPAKPISPSEPPLPPKVAPEAPQAAEPALVEPAKNAIAARQQYKTLSESYEEAVAHLPEGERPSKSQWLRSVVGKGEEMPKPHKPTEYPLVPKDPVKVASPDDFVIPKNAIAVKRAAAKEAGAQFVPKPAAEPKPAMTDTPAANNFIAKRRAEAAAKAEVVEKQPWEMGQEEYASSEMSKIKNLSYYKPAQRRAQEQSLMNKWFDENEKAFIDGKNVQWKPSWALTAEEAAKRSDDTLDATLIASHKRGVQEALSEGKPVPPEVLKDYPDLVKKAEPPEPRKSEVPPPPAPLAKTIAERRKPAGGEFTADRKALLAQVDEKMPKASTADGYETVDWKAYNRLSRAAKADYQMPDNVGKFGTVTFETPSGVKYEIANHKKALEAFKKRVSGGGYKPETMPKSKPTTASGARIKAEEKGIAKDVEYYNEYRPRKSTVQAEKTSVDVYEDGIYSNGYYGIKTEQPVLKKAKYLENLGARELFKENLKEAKEQARIVGEFVSPHTKEGSVQAHIVGKKGTEVIVNAEYVDKILTKYPNATAHVIAPDRMVVFKEGDKMVGFVMPQMAERGETGIEAFFGKSLKPRANEVLTGKGLPPTQLMAGGVAGIEQDENGEIQFNPAKAALGMGAMGIAGKVQARRAAIAEKVKGSTIARDFVNMVKGESGVPKPLQQAFRAGEGRARDAITGSADLGKQMHVNFFKAQDSPAMVKLADAAHRGDKAALDRIARFNKPLAEQITRSRTEIDATTDALIGEIKKLYPDGNMPVKWEGNTIPAGKLIEVMEKNKGSYVRREYSINHVDGYKPSEQQWTDAVKGYMKDHPGHTEEQARIFLKRELELHGIGDALPNMSARINKSPFMARENSPVWLRDFMGEIKDPALNHYLTTKALANNVAKMRIFGEIAKNKSIFFDKATKDAVATVGDYVQVSARDDALAWGAIADKYTTPEMAEFLGDISKLDNVYDATFKSGIAALKKLKTSQNIPTHIRNFLGNIDFAMIGGISPLNPKNHKFYQQGRAALLGKNEALRHELIQEGVIGTELAHAELINTSHDMINLMNEGKNWTDRLKKGIGAFDRGLTKAYSLEDQYFKAAKYLEARSRGLSKRDAVSEVYKFFPNYAEVSRFAKGVRESGVGSVLMPFFSFKSEAHRIFMNIVRDGSPAEKAKLAAVLGWRSTYNLAALTAKGIPLGAALGYLWKNNQINGSLADPKRPNRRGMTQRGIMPFDNYLPDERTFQGNIISGPIQNVMRAKGAGNKIKGFAKGINATTGAIVSAAVDKDPSKLWDAIIPFRQEKYK